MPSVDRLAVVVACALGLCACAVGRNEKPPPGDPYGGGPRWDIGHVPTFDGGAGTSSPSNPPGNPPSNPPPQHDSGPPPPPPNSLPPDQGVHPDVYVPPPPPPPPPPVSSGWGASCATDADCQNGLFCILLIGKPKGYCTQRCTALGAGCPGTPTGQLAACIIPAQDGNYCGFLCRTSARQQHSCPAGLYCSPTDYPVGSGQHDCLTP